MAKLAKLCKWLEKIREEALPKGEAGQAIAYALKNWTASTRYLKDGDLSIDTTLRYVSSTLFGCLALT